MEDAAFLLGTVVLKPEEIAAASGISSIAWCVGARQDTLHSLGCRDEEEVVVRAAGTLVSLEEDQLSRDLNHRRASETRGGINNCARKRA